MIPTFLAAKADLSETAEGVIIITAGLITAGKKVHEWVKEERHKKHHSTKGKK